MGAETGAVDQRLRMFDAHRRSGQRYFASGIHAPRRCSIAKVSRAAWPGASTTRSAAMLRRIAAPPRGSCLAPDQQVRSPVAAKRYSPPRASTWRASFHHRHQAEGADMRLAACRVSLPARHGRRIPPAPCGRGSGDRGCGCTACRRRSVPAPPSPNCTLLSGVRTDRRHSASGVLGGVRAPACSRSRDDRAWKPASARLGAAHSPQGPAPIGHRAAAEPLRARGPNGGSRRVSGCGRCAGPRRGGAAASPRPPPAHPPCSVEVNLRLLARVPAAAGERGSRAPTPAGRQGGRQ